MTNHVHLLVTPVDAQGCALMMRDLGRCYAAYFNRRYQKIGALWQHPFRSCLVDSAEYVITCYRYIERNPVRAKMVRRPEQYPWSSYAGNARLRSDELLTPHPEYLALGLDDTSRPRLYRDLLSDEDRTESLKAMREATDAGFPLVGSRLKAQLERAGVRFERATPGPRADPGVDEPAAGQLAFLTE
jgi:putative transposase